jgi:hypothetical protein
MLSKKSYKFTPKNEIHEKIIVRIIMLSSVCLQKNSISYRKFGIETFICQIFKIHGRSSKETKSSRDSKNLKRTF